MAETTVEERQEDAAAKKARDEALIAEVKKADEKPPHPIPEINSEFRKVYRVMTLDDLALSRTASVRDGRCVLYAKNNYHEGRKDGKYTFMSGEWNTRVGYDTTSNMQSVFGIEYATPFKVLDIIKHKKLISSGWLAGLLEEEALANEPKRRNYKVEELINQTLINLGRVAPTNPTFRAHLMSLFGQLPPVELKTWEQVKDWMEYLPKPKFLESRQAQYAWRKTPESTIQRQLRERRERDAQNRPQPQNQEAETSGFTVHAEYREKVLGSCNYSVLRREQYVQHEITGHWLTTMVEEGFGFDAMMGQIMSEVRNNAETNNLENVPDSEETCDHEIEETQDQDMRPNIARIRADLEAWIRRTYGAEEAQAIIGRP